MIDEDAIRTRWDAVGSKLDERGRRLFAAGEVRTAGWGGLAVVSRITGLARSTINRGEDDLDAAEPFAKGQVRRVGAGRKAVAASNPALVPALKRLVEPATYTPQGVVRAQWRGHHGRVRRQADESEGHGPGKPHRLFSIDQVLPPRTRGFMLDRRAVVGVEQQIDVGDDHRPRGSRLSPISMSSASLLR